MHLLSFVRPARTPRKPPPIDIQHTVHQLIDDIQMLALHDRDVVLEILAQFAHEERALLPEQQHGDLSQN